MCGDAVKSGDQVTIPFGGNYFYEDLNKLPSKNAVWGYSTILPAGKGQIKLFAIVFVLSLFVVLVFAVSQNSTNLPPTVRARDVNVTVGNFTLVLAYGIDPEGENVSVDYPLPLDKWGIWTPSNKDVGTHIFTFRFSDGVNIIYENLTVVVFPKDGAAQNRLQVHTTYASSSANDVRVEVAPPVTGLAVLDEPKVEESARIQLSSAADEEHTYIVKYRDGASRPHIDGVRTEKSFDRLHMSKIRGNQAAVNALLEDDAVLYVEADQDTRFLGDAIPYGVAATLAPDVWTETNGTGVKVAILDTGIAAHADLSVAGGISIIGGNYTDTHGHGTQVAGVLSAQLNDAGLVGVSPGVEVYAVKIAEGATGSLSDALSGLEWAMNNSMDIVTMSFALQGYSSILKEAVDDAYNQGILLIAASGNAGGNGIVYPAAYDSVIAVGAVDENLSLASFSNYGTGIELVAAGVGVNTTDVNEGYTSVQGTSYAVPHVAGVAALLKSYNSSWTNTMIRGKMQHDALDIGAAGPDASYGFGAVRVNLTSRNFSLSDPVQAPSTGPIPHAQYCALWYAQLNGTDDPSYASYQGYCEQDNIYFLDYNCADRYDKPLEDTWDLDTDGSYGGGSQESYFHDISGGAENTGTHGILELDSGETAYFYINHTTQSTWQNFTWNFFSLEAYNANDAVFYCYNYSRNSFSRIATYKGDSTNLVINIPNECTTSSPLGLQIYKGGAINGDVIRFTGEIISFLNSTQDCSGQESQPVNLCNGTITANAEMNSGVASGAYVYKNAVLNGTTDTNGQRIMQLKNVECNIDQNISVYCSNNQSKLCGVQKTSIDFNGDEDSLFFDCSLCGSGNNNLKASLGDVTLTIASGETYTIRTLVHSLSIDASNVNVTVKGQSATTGLILREVSSVIPTVSGSKNYNVTVSMDLSDIDYLHIYIDPNNNVSEVLKTDNYLLVPVVKQKLKANVSIATGSGALVDRAIREYLAFFVDDVPQAQADVIISIGKLTPEVNAYNQRTLIQNGRKWGLKDGNQVHVNDVPLENPYEGIVGYYFTSPSTPPILFIYGNWIDGDVAALKSFLSHRQIYQVSGYEITTRPLIILDSHDTNAIGVYDLMHNNESRNYYNKGTEAFADVVTDILNNNNFEISIHTVKTTNDNTTLRLKNVNSDYSANFKDAITNTSKPVVFAGGIFSNLVSWEDSDGLALQLASDPNYARNVWEIELTGGPATDADCQPEGTYNCPNYTYQDQVVYYWPALIAGVEEYSGQSKIDYVGHSNGGRVALSSLNLYSQSGKNIAGYCFNPTSGAYDISCDLSSNAVDTFVGVAIPATLNDETTFTKAARYVNCFGPWCYPPAGNLSMQLIDNRHLSHVRRADYTAPLIIYNPPSVILDIIAIRDAFEKEKISRNLMAFYNNLAMEENSTFNLTNVSVNKLYLLNAAPNDVIVGVNDQQRILDGTTSIVNGNKQGFNYTGALTFNHGAIFKKENVKNDIIGVLK